MIHGSILQNMDHDARKLQAKRALDVTSMSVRDNGRERRSVLMAEDRIEQHLKRTYGTGLNGTLSVFLKERNTVVADGSNGFRCQSFPLRLMVNDPSSHLATQ